MSKEARSKFRPGQKVRLLPTVTSLSPPNGYPQGFATFVREFPAGMGHGGYQFKLIPSGREVFVPYVDEKEVVAPVGKQAMAQRLAQYKMAGLSAGWFKDWKDHPLPGFHVFADLQTDMEAYKAATGRSDLADLGDDVTTWMGRRVGGRWTTEKPNKLGMYRGPYFLRDISQFWKKFKSIPRKGGSLVILPYATLSNVVFKPYKGIFKGDVEIPLDNWPKFVANIKLCHDRMESLVHTVDIPAWLDQLEQYTGQVWKLDYTSNIPSTSEASYSVNFSSGSDKFNFRAFLEYWPKVPSKFDVTGSWQVQGKHGPYFSKLDWPKEAFRDFVTFANATGARDLLELIVNPDQWRDDTEDALYMASTRVARRYLQAQSNTQE